MKDKFKKIIKTISEYNIFYSSVTITILLAVSQFYAYLKKVYFYSYFNISSAFIQIDIYHDLSSLFHTFLLVSILVAEILLIDCVASYIYDNLKNIKGIKNWCIVIIAIVVFYALIVGANTYIDFIISGKIIYSWFIPLFCFCVSFVIRIIVNNIKKGIEEGDAIDKRMTNIFIVIFIIFAIISFNKTMTEQALESAEKLQDFYVISDSKIVLYLTKDNAIVADYVYIGDNEISINTSKLTKINIINEPLSFMHFDKVEISEESVLPKE